MCIRDRYCVSDRECVAGVVWRNVNQAVRGGSWLRNLAAALAVVVLTMSLAAVGNANAQARTIKISGNDRTAMVMVTIGKSQDVQTGTSFADVTVGDPEIADVNPLTDHCLL